MTSLKRILLVEDSPRDAELMLDALEENQLANEVVHLRDGADALDYLYRRGTFADRADGQPALMLLDLKLPKVDGLEVLARIKGDPRTRHIPIVILTSSKEQADVVKSYQLGVNSYIVKPVNFESFTAAVQELGMYWLLINQSPKLDK